MNRKLREAIGTAIAVIIILMIFVSVFPPKARAESYLLAGGWSTHLATSEDYNSTHGILGYQSDKLITLSFKNSYYNRAELVAYELLSTEHTHYTLSLHAGAVYGYKSCSGGRANRNAEAPDKVCPTIIPSIRFRTPYLEPTVAIFGSAVVLYLTIPLD